MSGVADMALTIASLVSLEVIERLNAAIRVGPVVSVMRVVTIVYVPVKAVWPVEPGTGPDEEAPIEPVRAVVAVGSTIVRRVIEVSVRASRRSTNAHRNLCRCY